MDFENYYNLVTDYTLLDRERLLKLWCLVAYANHSEVAGDIVECGCYKGGSAAVLRGAMGKGRKLWIYDSFEGMPVTTERDGDEAHKYVGMCKAEEADVHTIMRLTGATGYEYAIEKGWFCESFKRPLPKQVAILHIDADWYESVSIVLNTFYPLVPEGGCVILDDFGYWEGCREAFYDFCAKFRERPVLERVGCSQAYWIKGKQHNRSGVIV